MANDEDDQNIKIMKAMLVLAEQRTQKANERTIMAAQRSYMNAERTLSVWIRTALASMIFGIAIDRLGLVFKGLSKHPQTLFGYPSTASTITGSIMVLFSILIALTSGLRFRAYARTFKKEYKTPAHHKAWLPITYAFMAVIFGAALMILMLWVD